MKLLTESNTLLSLEDPEDDVRFHPVISFSHQRRRGSTRVCEEVSECQLLPLRVLGVPDDPKLVLLHQRQAAASKDHVEQRGLRGVSPDW